ncbi:helix-turn-helix domain-containing protein [Cellulosimicrobium cellulans]|uniref:helix-turn-helix domain-containing protein n=1 Tax=Cellulosimicrobium cellulans TaxID=1710 RepID=UPI003015F19F
MSHPEAPLGDFLRARRSSLTPADVDLPPSGQRRVPGLRRDEVARRAGISSQYYLRLEQGRDRQPSPRIIDALARALRLDQHGVAYMSRLVAREASSVLEVLSPVCPTPERLLAPYATQAAFVTDSNFDILATTDVARALSDGEWVAGANLVASVFSARMRSTVEGWEGAARRVVASLRFRSDPYDSRLQALVGGLAIRDADFRRIWARHESRPTYSETFRQQVAGLGSIGLLAQTFHVPAAPGWTLTAVVPDAREDASVAAVAYLAAGGSVPEQPADAA